MAFAELAARSCFSFLEGASQPAELVEQAARLGLGAIGICDRDGLYGLARALRAQRALGEGAPKLVVGASLTLEGGASLPLLAQDGRGYENLCRLISRSHEGQPKGEASLPLSALEGREGGLIALIAPTPGRGYSERLAAQLRAAFGDRAYLLAHRHFVADDRARDRQVKWLSRRLGLPVVASSRPLMHVPERRAVADVFACLRQRTTLDRAGRRLLPNAEAYLRGEADMRRVFRDRPAWVEASAEIAARCSFSLSELRYGFPCAMCAPGESPDAALARLVAEHLPWRYPEGTPPAVLAQIARELALIARVGVAPYFLSVVEIVQIARQLSILCQGRGSAANSAVCYALGVTSVDPSRSSLLFERFLSEERREPPDIDVDFEHERREEVIQAIYRRYGRDRAAMVSEVISYRGKSALREVGRAFGLPDEQLGRLSDAASGGGELSVDRLREVGLDPASDRVKQIARIAKEIQGFPRHLSIHVGGFVLSEGPLFAVAPIEPARMEDRTVVQWDKDDLDTLGFFKVDVLALGMLTAVRKGLELVHSMGEPALSRASCASRASPDAPFDPLAALAAIPAEDHAVYEAFCAADTVGVFQIESRAQMAMLPQLRPRRFYDLVVEVALVRPGPIQGGMVHPYLRRRAGQEPVVCPHPSLEPILSRTLGVPLFQEQVMQLAIVGAGYSGGEADGLRRDMAAWRKTGMLERHRKRLVDGFVERGVAEHFGEALYRQIQGFGEYGFPESHAASFALIVYASGWLKVHHPAAFACALLNSQPMGFYSPSALVQDAQRHGVEVRDVSVVDSAWDCTLEWASTRSRPARSKPQPALRLGLRLLRGFGARWAAALCEAREARAFSDIDDLIRRACLARREVELLAESGALEPLLPGRREALWRARAPLLPGLFADLPLDEGPPPALPALRPIERLSLDYKHKGLSIDDHPMRHLRLMLPSGITRTADLRRAPDGSRVAVAGLVQSRQRPGTASGVVFVTLEDETGSCNVVLWASVFERHRFIAVHARALLIRGRLERRGDVVHVVADAIERIDGAAVPERHSSRDFH
jgi:error-prone DNA polymerase